MPVSEYDVIVVGGGIGGLVVAVELGRRGLRTLLLEAAAEPGGCVRLHSVGGLTLDRGADSFALARPAVAELATRLDLPVERPIGAGAWVRHEAGDAPLPAGALLGIPSDPAAADVRRIIGRAGVLRARADLLLPGRAPDNVGLGHLVARRMGRRVLRRLVEPVVGGVYSTDPGPLDIDAVAPGLRAALADSGSLAAAVRRLRAGAPPAGAAVAGLTGGMGTLTGALVGALLATGGEIRCGAPVQTVTPAGTGWSVTTASGDLLQTEVVVLALSAGDAAPLVSRATAGGVRLPTPPASEVVLVTLVVDEPALDVAPRGTGVLVGGRARGVAAKALTHATAKWRYLASAAGPGRHVLRLSYGRGDRLPPDAAFPDLALADAAALLGIPLRREQLADHAVVHYTGQLAAHRSDLADARSRFHQDLTAWPGLVVTGSAVAGTGLGAVVANATATAATITGNAGEGWTA